jgi:hypothetical protein
MAARERTALRGRLRPARLRAMLAVAGLLGFFACLNPQPDPDPLINAPSGQDTTDVSPKPESCDDNPMLAGCSPSSMGGPPQADTSSGAGGAENTGSGAGNAGSAGSVGTAADAGGDLRAGERDAGPDDAMQGAADAG